MQQRSVSRMDFPGFFDDQNWPLAKVIANHGDNPWNTINGIAMTAKWIWENTNSNTAYCRLTLQ